MASKSNRAEGPGSSEKKPLPGSRIKGFPYLPLLVAMVAGCATAGRGSDSPAEPISWPVGHYHLEGTVEYRRDTEATVRTVHSDYRAEADILADGTMSLNNPSGPCRESLSGQLRQGRVPRQRTFWCNDVNYVLKPAAGTIRGEIHVWVIEAVQRRGICRRTGLVNGMQVCVDYPLEVGEQPVDRTARLSVVQKGPAKPTSTHR